MERTLIKDIFNTEEKVQVKGWATDVRSLSKIRFIVLRDRTGKVQITGVDGETDSKLFELMDNIPKESALLIEGKMKESNKAPGGKELVPEKIEVLSEAKSPLPIHITKFSKTELPVRLNYRYVDLHSERTQAIFKIQSTMLQAYRNFMTGEGAIEALFPAVIGSSSEGGTELYKLKYFEKDAYLSQSCQLYKQMVACSMERVFSIFTTWRAEKHNTVRHLNEARQFDFEASFMNDKGAMEILGNCVQYIVKEILEKNKEELDYLDVSLKVPEIKYLTFEKTNELLKKEKVETNSTDLTGEGERKLGELYPDTIVFVHDWPLKGKPFYIIPKDGDENAELSHGFDAIYKGMEISSGGQRVHDPELLTKRITQCGLNPKDFEAYIDNFRYGAPEHAGWGLGVERLTMLLLGLKNIREAVLFPRDRERLIP